MEIQELKAIAKRKGITYEEIANKAGVSLGTIKDIFRGKTTNPRIETVKAIEDALGLNEPAEEYVPKDKLYRDLLKAGLTEEAYNRMTPDEREAFLKVIQMITQKE